MNEAPKAVTYSRVISKLAVPVAQLAVGSLFCYQGGFYRVLSGSNYRTRTTQRLGMFNINTGVHRDSYWTPGKFQKTTKVKVITIKEV